MEEEEHIETRAEYWGQGEGLVNVKEWLTQRLTNQQIADLIGVDRTTLRRWRNKFPALDMLFKKERGVATHELASAAFKSAMGYYYEEEVLDIKGNKQMVKKWAQPSVAAQMFMLKNLDRDNYRDRWEIDHSGALPVILKGEEEIPD